MKIRDKSIRAEKRAVFYVINEKHFFPSLELESVGIWDYFIFVYESS